MHRCGTKVLIVAFAALCVCGTQVPAAAQGYPNGYAHRRAITIDHTKVPNSDQKNFPVLISGTFSYLASTSNGGQVTNANGYDLIFTTDFDGFSAIPYERQSYNPSTGTVNFWVQIPQLSHTSDTVIFLFYGNSSISTDQSNPTRVWDSYFQGVWHFNQTPNGSGSEKDSTSNGYHGTPASSGISLSSDGMAGSSLFFDGTSASNQVTMSSALPGGAPMTVSIWIKTVGENSTSQSEIVNKLTWSSMGWSMADDGQYNAYTLFRSLPNYNNQITVPRSSINNGVWHYLVGTLVGSTLSFYFDGTLQGSTSYGSMTSDSTDPMSVGGFGGGGGGGLLTEVRVSNVPRSADWISTEYNNESNPSTFCTIQGSDWSNGYGFSQAIKIDHTKVPNTDQLNFPVLISGTYSYLATTANGGNLTNTNGYDIIFTSDANGYSPLAYERQSYNPSTGAVNFWVKVPRVSHTSDTVIYVFYGNSLVTTDQSNSTAVWDNNYKGVWHFNQTPNGSGSEKDSTANGYNGTPAASGISLSSDGIAGSSLKFDGVSGANNVSMSSALPGGAPMTASLWMKTTGLNSTSQTGIFNKFTWSSMGWNMADDGQYNAYLFFRTMPNWGSQVTIPRSSLNNGIWHYVVGTLQSGGTSSSTTLKLYFDSSLQGTQNPSNMTADTTDPVTVGGFTANAGGGLITEVRLSNIPRTPDWITTEFNSENSPSTFYSVISTPPSITSLSPTSGPTGTVVTISGANFGSAQGSSTVTFRGVPATPTSWSNSSISVAVPIGTSTGNVAVSVSNVSSNGVQFNVTSPTITSLIPSSGGPGTAILISGMNFGANQGVSTVTFNGTAVTPTDWSDSGIVVPVPGGATTGNVVVTVGGVASNGSSFQVTSLPPGWLDADLGSVGVAGSASSANGTFTVNGSGTSMSGTSDSGHIVYQPITGNVTITARIVSLQGGSSTQEAGVLVRETLDAGAKDVYMAWGSGTPYFEWRSITWASTSSQAGPAAALPSWVKLVRSGNMFRGYTSQDGQDWTPVASQTVSMATSVYMALATSSEANTSLGTVLFDNVSVISTAAIPEPLPTGWSDADIGQTGLIGSATYGDGTFTVSGAGNGAGATADSFHFAYQTMSGDGSIVARLSGYQGGYSPQVGIMIRETLDPGATSILLGYLPQPATNVYLWSRSTTGGNTSLQTVSGANQPYWFKLVRSGSTFTGYISSDGVNWTQGGATSVTISMAQNVYVGLVASNGATNGFITGTFDNVSVSSTAAPAPVITNLSATTGSIGNQIVITGSNFGSSQGSSLVTLNALPMTVNSWSNTSITITITAGAASGPMLVSVGPNMNDSNYVNFTVTANPLPSGWLDQDIGNPGTPGKGTYSNGIFSVSGSGYIGGTADALHIVYETLSGDGTIVARLVNPQGNASGVMIRETLNPNSTNALLTYFPGYVAVNFSTRSSSGGSTSISNFVGVSLPVWLKLTRSGSTFTAYEAPDGIYWTQVGSSVTISMAQTVYVGLAVASGYSTLATSDFDNVSITAGTPTATPVITGVTPASGTVGTSVTVTGSNFGSAQGTSSVRFNGASATSITSWSATQIVASVPSTASSGPVSVVVNSTGSNTNYLFSFYNPIISSATPSAAEVRGYITLSGTGFGPTEGNSQVQFNGVAAAISSWSNTSVVAVVPTGATSGPITLTEGGFTSNGVQFTVIEPVSISGISPASGPIGATVTITGAGFGPTQSNSVANFYGAPATITSWSDTSIVAVVPAGASTGPVSVQVAGITVYGPQFTLTSTLQLTDSLSNTSTYTSAVAGGSWYVTDSTGSGCSSCTQRGTIHKSYDTHGNILSDTDELGRVKNYTYDSNGNALTISQQDGNGNTLTTTYTYNSFNEVLTVTDPMGFVTTNTYDANGNLLTVKTPKPNSTTNASVTQFAYNSLGELTQITDPLNNVTKLTYTSAGLIATITDAQNNVTTYGYDNLGNRTSVTDALNHQTTFTYDSMNRLTKITYPDSTTTQFGYDYRGRRTSVTDQNGKVTQYGYDDADRLTTVTDAASNVTTYGYDTESNLTSIKDANSNTTGFAYDAFGRVTKTTFPSGYIEQYNYDAVNNLTNKTDRKNQSITYTYDQLNRLTQKSYPDTSTVNYTYDLDSRLTQVTDPTGTYQFTFDNMGRLTSATASYTFLTSRNFTTSYGYDAASNRTGLTDPENGSTTYAYDALNRLQTLTPPTAIGGGSFGFSYDGLSRRTQMTRPNNISTNYTYDNLSRLLSVLHQAGSTTLDGASYTVDNAGNRTAKTNQHSGVTSNYSYDPLYELTQVTQAANTVESYSYDPVGNRLTSIPGIYSNNSSNEMTASPTATYTYDYNGNTLTKVVGSNTTSFAWDYENRLTTVTLPGSGGTVTFKYDPFGRRIYKSSSNGTSVYAYDSDNLIEEANSLGAVVARYSQDLGTDEPLAVLRSSTTSYYHLDGLGTVTSLSSGAGALVQTYAFDSFGNQIAASGSLTNPFDFTAREFDPETSLYYYRARYYDPGIGRFLSEDPINFGGSGPNFYAYVFNSPTNLLDPSGWKPGDKYPSLECAGFQAVKDINPRSRHKSPAWPFGREYGGWLYKNPDGTYSYTSPVPGTGRSVSTTDFTPVPEGASRAGAYHTHGAWDPAVNAEGNAQPGQNGYDPNYDGNQIFGPGDKDALDKLNLPGILGTPLGAVKEYIPKPGHARKGKTTPVPSSVCPCQ